jgi:hypothetical protein
MRALAFVLFLKALCAYDRARLRWRALRRPGLEIHPTASSNFAAADFAMAPGSRLRIGAGATTERRPGMLRFDLGPGAVVEIGEGAWLRTAREPVHVVAFAGAVVELGPDTFLNGAHLSAKQSLCLGRRSSVGLGSRIFDSDQHDFDAERPERTASVCIGDFVWIASDVTVLQGVTIGDHSVIGTRSVVTRDVPAHSLALGIPAVVRGTVGDRSNAR